MFKVKELFYSIQGEGHYAGTPSIFCRFSGCNKWSGREIDKAESACPFCDTDFVGGSKYSLTHLCDAIVSLWPSGGRPRVVFTGGEPALQLTAELIRLLRMRNVTSAIETNGSVVLPDAGPYWVTVSPKDSDLVVTKGNEIKVLWPNPLTPPEIYEGLDFRYFYLQPIDGPEIKANTLSALQYVLAHPKWSLSLQQHKLLGVR